MFSWKLKPNLKNIYQFSLRVQLIKKETIKLIRYLNLSYQLTNSWLNKKRNFWWYWLAIDINQRNIYTNENEQKVKPLIVNPKLGIDCLG